MFHVGMRIITTASTNYWGAGEIATILHISNDNDFLAHFHAQNVELYIYEYHCRPAPDLGEITIIENEKFSSDVSQKYVGQKVSIEIIGDEHIICKCPDENVVTFSVEEINEEELKKLKLKELRAKWG
jgi:hypothetical protein